MGFLVENAGTIGTGLVVAAVVFLIVRKLIRDAASGKSMCGGCSSCGTGRRHHGNACGCQAAKGIAEKISALDEGKAAGLKP